MHIRKIVLSSIVFLSLFHQGFALKNYYSLENLEEINLKNSKIEQLKDEVIKDQEQLKDEVIKDQEQLQIESIADIAKNLLLRKKHAPLVILVDPKKQENQVKAEAQNLGVIDVFFELLIESTLSPLILIDYSVLKSLSSHDSFKDIWLEHSSKYELYKVSKTQFYIFIPKWFKKKYPTDHGLQFEQFETVGMNSESIEASYDFDKDSSEKGENQFEKRFVEEIKSVFLTNDQDLPAPVWDVFFAGHGLENEMICGLRKESFSQVLRYFSDSLDVGIMHIESCYAGGSNSAWLNQEIEESGRLRFHLVMTCVGNTPTVLNFKKNQEWIQMIEVFFNQATMFLHRQDSKKGSSTDEENLEKFIARTMMYALSDRSNITMGGLNNSEYIPFYKAAHSSKFKHISDQSYLLILNKKNSKEAHVPSKEVNTIILSYSDINELIISPIKTKKNNIYPFVSKALDIIFRGLDANMPDSIKTFPTIIMNDAFDKYFIDSLTLTDVEKKQGIAYFCKSFFTKSIASSPVLCIKELIGLNDIASTIKTYKEEQLPLLNFLSEMENEDKQLKLTDVVIIKKLVRESSFFYLTGKINEKRYDFFIDYDFNILTHSFYLNKQEHSLNYLDRLISEIENKGDTEDVRTYDALEVLLKYGNYEVDYLESHRKGTELYRNFLLKRDLTALLEKNKINLIEEELKKEELPSDSMMTELLKNAQSLKAFKLLVQHGAVIKKSEGLLSSFLSKYTFISREFNLSNSDFKEMIEYMLSEGADINEENHHGESLLSFAIRGSLTVDIIEILLSLGAQADSVPFNVTILDENLRKLLDKYREKQKSSEEDLAVSDSDDDFSLTSETESSKKESSTNQSDNDFFLPKYRKKTERKYEYKYIPSQKSRKQAVEWGSDSDDDF